MAAKKTDTGTDLDGQIASAMADIAATDDTIREGKLRAEAAAEQRAAAEAKRAEQLDKLKALEAEAAALRGDGGEQRKEIAQLTRSTRAAAARVHAAFAEADAALREMGSHAERAFLLNNVVRSLGGQEAGFVIDGSLIGSFVIQAGLLRNTITGALTARGLVAEGAA